MMTLFVLEGIKAKYKFCLKRNCFSKRVGEIKIKIGRSIERSQTHEVFTWQYTGGSHLVYITQHASYYQNSKSSLTTVAKMMSYYSNQPIEFSN